MLVVPSELYTNFACRNLPSAFHLHSVILALQFGLHNFIICFKHTQLFPMNAIFSDLTPCDSCTNRRFGGLCIFRGFHRLLVTVNVVPSSLNLVTLMLEVLVPSKRWFLQEAHRVTSQKTTFFLVTAVKTSYYIALTGWTL
jgi:hypothetical protein